MEIISPSDKPPVLSAKIADYRSVNVREVWAVRSEPQIVEVVRLSVDEIATVAEYGTGETIVSLAFPGLRIAVDDIFSPHRL